MSTRKHATRACDSCRAARKRCEYVIHLGCCKRCYEKKCCTFSSTTKKRGRKKIPFYEKPSGDPMIDAYTSHFDFKHFTESSIPILNTPPIFGHTSILNLTDIQYNPPDTWPHFDTIILPIFKKTLRVIDFLPISTFNICIIDILLTFGIIDNIRHLTDIRQTFRIVDIDIRQTFRTNI
ncbi:6400_t:CDS:2 [Acaulospora morrowiae]|uniref:6400_t:CDS:1 n=1 Tax=Acaulospora morrowiae TaxID=94023 RepID=A0A9N9BUQ4_9GLOM|nr:6400_t:CDS:2 [Acaulospora morrowiae]